MSPHGSRWKLKATGNSAAKPSVNLAPEELNARKSDQPFQVHSSRPADPDFRPMVRRATFVAVVGWAVKVGWMLKVNRDLGGLLHMKTWGPGIPYMAFEIPRASFMVITSSSTRAMSYVLLAMLVAGLLRNKSKLHVAGWCFAPVALGYSLALDHYLQATIGNYTDVNRLKWAVGALSLSLLLVAWWIAVEHPHEALESRRQRFLVSRPAVRGSQGLV